MFDKRILKTLRIKAQDNSYFALFKYRNNGGKNHWNLICSCMDWITVSLDGIDDIYDDISDLDINTQCMRVYSYISAVDILWESVKQLHRVIVGNTIPFDNESTIFSNNICKDDNTFFKHLRAIFGAHPVMLNDNGEKRFASWPTSGVYTEYDYACILYSSNPEKDDIVIGIKLKELYEFAESRYMYINHLVSLIEEEYQKFSREMIAKPIKREENITHQLYILKEESKSRLNNDYYNHTIEKLIMCFEVQDIVEEYKVLVDYYRSKLIKVVNEVLTNLERMNLVDLDTDSILNPEHNSDVMHAYSKLSEYIHTGYNYQMVNYAISKLNDYFDGIIILDGNMSNDELLLYCNTGLYIKNHK